MTTDAILAQQIEPPGSHLAQFQLFGMTFNGDTMWTSTIAALVVLGTAFLVRRGVTSGVPRGIQLVYEALTNYFVSQVETRFGRRPAEFVLPLCLALFLFILVANWIEVIPSGHPPKLKPPTSDANLPYAMALFVFFSAWFFGLREKGAGAFTHLVQPNAAILPINLIEEIVKPVSLSLRLFGNLLASTTMLSLIAIMPVWILWLPNAAWKLFALFIGAIQALIFALLTIIQNFGATAGEEAH